MHRFDPTTTTTPSTGATSESDALLNSQVFSSELYPRVPYGAVQRADCTRSVELLGKGRMGKFLGEKCD